MKKIIVAYWMGTMFEKVGIEHNFTCDYSNQKRNEIVDLVLSNGLQIMMYSSNDNLIIWIDNGRFRQR